MAWAVDRVTFADDEYHRFDVRLHENLRALRLLLERPGFGEGEPTLGAELECSIVDDTARPLPCNREIVGAAGNPRLALELNAYNLEYNLDPVAAGGRPFTGLQLQLDDALGSCNAAARPFGGRVVVIGMLPTLRVDDLQGSQLTDAPRYHALNAGLQRLGQTPFEVRISGEDALTLQCQDITLEGANTSFQVHLRVPPREFAATYNAAQMATAVAVAVSGNSPVFAGHRLWEETRIAVFKQALDTRNAEGRRWRAPCRVSFGHGWVRTGAAELFAESVDLFPPILPLSDDEPSTTVAADGGLPRLHELRLHHGTVWRWNRAIYDPGAGGHLRIEFRALPAGPTPLDMTANAAFLVGLTMGLAPRMDRILPSFPFTCAEYNLYRAAQAGLSARLLWPAHTAPSPVERPLAQIAPECFGIAEEGLSRLGIDDAEVHHLLGVVRDRLVTGTTGATWQRRTLNRELGRGSRDDALACMLEEYLATAATGERVANW